MGQSSQTSGAATAWFELRPKVGMYHTREVSDHKATRAPPSMESPEAEGKLDQDSARKRLVSNLPFLWAFGTLLREDVEAGRHCRC
jgi:hypothetical protein